MQNEKKITKSKPIAFCAMMAALSVVIMLTGGLIPVFTYCSPLISSILLIPVLFEYGFIRSWMVWFVTSVLSLLIGTDKEAAFFYIFLGWYPIIKPVIDRVPKRVIRILLKTGLFCLCVISMYALICFVFRIGDIIRSFSASTWVNLGFLCGLVLVMLLYDIVLVKIAVLYRNRLLPALKGKRNHI